MGKPPTKHHPFKDADIPNRFYFLNKKPENYNARDYFQTFSNLNTSSKGLLHGFWRKALTIMTESNVRVFQCRGRQLLSIWNLPDKGLKDFWRAIEQSGSPSTTVRTEASKIEKKFVMLASRTYIKAGRALHDEIGASLDNSRHGNPERKRRRFTSEEASERLDNLTDDDDDPSYSEAVSVDQGGQSNPNDRVYQDTDSDTFAEDYAGDAHPRQTTSKPTSTVYFLAGNGDVDCSEAARSPWMIQDDDLAGVLWDYRSTVCEKAKRLEGLVGSVERLAINHIYLFERKDSTSSLYAAIGSELWENITTNGLQLLLAKDVVLDLGEKAIQFSLISHQEAEDSVLSTPGGNKVIRKLLVALFSTGFLWGDQDYNEAERIKNLWDPFLKTYLEPIAGCKGRWEKEFQPSKERRQTDTPDSKGRRPDYFLKVDLLGLECFLFVLEAKKHRHTSPVQTDLEKVGNQLKDSIDYLARNRVDISGVRVYGAVVVGDEATVYSMELVASGVYVMKQYGVLCAPRSNMYLGLLGQTVNTLQNLVLEIEATTQKLKRTKLSTPCDWTRVSFRTPQKVDRTGIAAVHPSSPSTRTAKHSHSLVQEKF
ncbi:hypothetical protein K457DRAFT_16439 [Linnemannia elongata AG-77]|uniref:Uncharacterized protein n=1 Tax=Linnemannia elongata AG-77 TaxID=1314771 RepID=A0A197K462_9FUNG|nr:hypothetical protein K457DRAFT_16439 [Linnemannia elongata AG-77]